MSAKINNENNNSEDEQEEKIDKQSGRIDELLIANNFLSTKNIKMNNQIKRLLIKNDELREEKKEILDNIDKTVKILFILFLLVYVSILFGDTIFNHP
jgi:hypothetical protein